MIREVEHFGAELDRLALPDRESAIETKVEIAETVSVKNVSARIAERVHRVQLPCGRVVRPAVPPRAAVGEQRARIEPSAGVGPALPATHAVLPAPPATHLA